MPALEIPDANDLRLEADLLDALDNLRNERPQKVMLVVMKEKSIYVWWTGLGDLEAYGLGAMALDWIRRKIQP